MKQGLFKIEENIPLTDSVYRMRLSGDVSEITASGQFINIKLDGHFLRRPISVADVDKNSVTILYKVVGKGTLEMSCMKEGVLDVLTGLGNGYNIGLCGEAPLLLGGGVGIPPLYLLAKQLIAMGKAVTVILGFNTKSEIFYENEFRALGAKTIVTTVDGSYGIKGFVTTPMQDLSYTYFYTCGPEPMLKAIFKASRTSGQFSFEERMGCGFGACMGCSCKTVTGYKRICKEGPVLLKEEILWEK